MVSRKDLVELYRERIESGDLKPGERLPTTEQMVALHGVSESTVYEAMRELRNLGLIVSGQGDSRKVAGGDEEPTGDITPNG